LLQTVHHWPEPELQDERRFNIGVSGVGECSLGFLSNRSFDQATFLPATANGRDDRHVTVDKQK